ncbi:MAG: divergent polysaccharide deacetylase family protein [Gammaproteobacteria bacterium]
MVAIIIDDLGYSRTRGMRAINLPARLTYAMIPDTQYAASLARYAHDTGKEVMIHLPMENNANLPMSRIALTGNLAPEDIRNILDKALSRVPFATGINNHMGSSLTQQPEAMSWLMDSIKQRQLFFVDSRTTPKTIASNIARQKNIHTASRDIFLDNERNQHAIDLQFQTMMKMARQKRSIVAIGHPYPATLDYLERALPLLESEGIRVVPVSEVIRTRLAGQQVATGTASTGAE